MNAKSFGSIIKYCQVFIFINSFVNIILRILFVRYGGNGMILANVIAFVIRIIYNTILILKIHSKNITLMSILTQLKGYLP